ncbi:Na+/H+ antiporter NhaC family protein [Tissierella praeacuta]|uniref:Na+/H+ antiporter NhaC family protein n=1 Tax=Tissierella praeacuta TaxID=43131 RepID=UPI00333FF97D
MDLTTSYGILSLLPAMVAVVLAFVTKDAIFSLLIGILVGIFVTGQNVLLGFTGLVQDALGNADFIWVVCIEVFVGIMVAYFQKSGAIDAFTKRIEKRSIKAAGAQIISWLLGIFIFFSDYFSPLYVGTVMKGITDKAKVSREKLSYICSSTSAPVCTLIPFSAWGVYMAGLLVGIGDFADKIIATNAVIRMVPFNFYGILSVVMVGLIAIGIVPDFGPMKKAEKRARETGKVIADGANPMMGKELEQIKPNEGVKPNLLLNFFGPALIIIGVTLGTYLFTGNAKTLEGFIAAVVFQFITMLIQKMATIDELVKTATEGIKSIISAILILSLAYCLNTISKELGTANYVVSITKAWMTPTLLLLFTFITCAFVSFFTGTSWGTYAIMTPIAIPLAFNLTGGVINNVIYASIAAVMSGGCFGDHCSPISDTNILSSLASGSDHMDHVNTQMPYALSVAGITCILYLGLGFIL